MLIDREELRAVLKTIEMPPSSLTVLYGPRSTGKTTIIRAAATMADMSAVVVDMRGSYTRDWREALFIGRPSLLDRFRDMLASLVTKKKIYFGIEESMDNALQWLSLRNIGLIAIDEIQEADVKDLCSLTEFLIYLSKNEGLVHTIIASSDPFVLLKMLDVCGIAGSSEIIKVGEISEASSVIFLKRHGIGKNTAKKIISTIGSRPIELLSAVKYHSLGKLDEWMKSVLKAEESRIKRSIRSKKHEKVIKRVLEGDTSFNATEEEVDLIRKEILFLDPLTMELEFESTATKNAAEELFSTKKRKKKK